MHRLAESVKHLNHAAQNWLRGKPNWRKKGVLISQMGDLPPTIYLGDVYDCNCCAIIPNNSEHLPALWAFCTTGQFATEVRKISQKLNVTPGALLDVPFDLAHWQKAAAEKYPDGLPKPHSDDPTQWLFDGYPEVPRVAEASSLCSNKKSKSLEGSSTLSTLEDSSTFDEAALIAAAGKKASKSKTLEDWLRDEFFAQHCDIFHKRPFIWHIWDGRKDGFHALVNYHQLAAPDGGGRRSLETLTYGYLGDWITRQKHALDKGEEGADDRHAAALELQGLLEKILAGEPPHEQPIGWEPDINDGVRLNIRPFLATDLSRGRKGAGLFRAKLTIHWKKDRGKEPAREKADFPWFWNWDEESENFEGTGDEPDNNRWNALHYTTAVKQAARDRHAQQEGESS